MIFLHGEANLVSCSDAFRNLFNYSTSFHLCIPVVNPTCYLAEPNEFDFGKLCIFSSTALGEPIYAAYECLWTVLGLITQGYKSCVLLCSIRTFQSFCALQQTPSLLSFCLTHAGACTRTHTLHHPVSKLPLVSQGDLWVEAGFVKYRLPPGGVTATFVCQGSSRWRKKTSPVQPKDWHIQKMLSSIRISRTAVIKRNEVFAVKLVVVYKTFISVQLMKMY